MISPSPVSSNATGSFPAAAWSTAFFRFTKGLTTARGSTKLIQMLNRFNPTMLREVFMRTTQQLSITLPNEMADLVRAKVATGEYATESEVIREGLRTLLARDRAVEGWLREQVAPAYDALKADPSRAVSANDVRGTLSVEHKKAVKKR